MIERLNEIKRPIGCNKNNPIYVFSWWNIAGRLFLWIWFKIYHWIVLNDSLAIRPSEKCLEFFKIPISSLVSIRSLVLSAIKTMTLMYQKQRSRDEKGRFIADYIDYTIVYQLLEESFAESLGNAKRYTDDRIRMIEKQGMMTPRALSGKSGVSTAAISQWLKPLIEKGVLNWCDEAGAEFNDDQALEKAKRTGRAYICVAGGKSLPSPFQLTGDPRWDKDGDLYSAYDLQLDHGSGDGDQVGIGNESVVEVEDVAIDEVDAPGKRTTAVKV